MLVQSDLFLITFDYNSLHLFFQFDPLSIKISTFGSARCFRIEDVMCNTLSYTNVSFS